MGATTPKYALRYPVATDPADVPTDMHNLALDTEAAITTAAVPAVVNGSWLKGVGGAAVWSTIAAADLPPQAVPGYGTTLPASPTDGQEFVLVDSATTPTYKWRFRYNAGSTATYKWEFVGGHPALLAGGSLTTNSATPIVLAGSPKFTVPRNGEYMFLYGCDISISDPFSGAYQGVFQPYLAGLLIGYGALFVPSAANARAVVSSVAFPVAATAGQVVDMRASVNAVINTIFQSAWMEVQPTRVS
jgi:hypothetical protein